jgi:hypothetical protein
VNNEFKIKEKILCKLTFLVTYLYKKKYGDLFLRSPGIVGSHKIQPQDILLQIRENTSGTNGLKFGIGNTDSQTRRQTDR